MVKYHSIDLFNNNNNKLRVYIRVNPVARTMAALKRLFYLNIKKTRFVQKSTRFPSVSNE